MLSYCCTRCTDQTDQIDHDLDQIDQIDQIDHDLDNLDHLDQIDQIAHDQDHLDQIDHDLDHLVTRLPLREVVQDLHSTDPTHWRQVLGRADYTAT